MAERPEKTAGFVVAAGTAGRKGARAPWMPTMAVAKGVTDGKPFELYLDAMVSKTDLTKWNRRRLGKWQEAPRGARCVAQAATHGIREWI